MSRSVRQTDWMKLSQPFKHHIGQIPPRFHVSQRLQLWDLDRSMFSITVLHHEPTMFVSILNERAKAFPLLV